MEPLEEQRVKEDEKKAEQLLQSISKDEERVREQVQRLGDLHAQFNNQFLRYLRAITENDAFTHLKELPPPKTWDLISYEVDIQHEGFEFKSIREDVRHVATYKIASALEEPLIQISYAYAEGFRWIRHCDSMKEEAILYQHHGGCLRYFNLHLQRRRKDFLQALEAMELGLGRAEASLKLNLSSLRDDPGYAKHTTSYPKDTLQNLFRQVLDSINGEWREKDVDVVNAKLLPVYQREFVLAMNDATPWNGRLEKACDTCREIRSLITKPNDNDTHRKRKIPSHPTLHSKAPAKKFRLKLESAVKCTLSYSSMPFHETIN
jgi:hypothetical protein